MKDETLRMAGGRLFHARDAAMLPFSSAQLVEQKVNTRTMKFMGSNPCVFLLQFSRAMYLLSYVLYSNQKNTD